MRSHKLLAYAAAGVAALAVAALVTVATAPALAAVVTTAVMAGLYSVAGNLSSLQLHQMLTCTDILRKHMY